MRAVRVEVIGPEKHVRPYSARNAYGPTRNGYGKIDASFVFDAKK